MLFSIRGSLNNPLLELLWDSTQEFLDVEVLGGELSVPRCGAWVRHPCMDDEAKDGLGQDSGSEISAQVGLEVGDCPRCYHRRAGAVTRMSPPGI